MDPLAEKNLISTKAASDISGYNSDYLARLCRSGKIIGTQVGRTWLVSQASLEEFVKSQDVRKQELREHLSETREKEYRNAQSPKKVREKTSIRSIAPVFSDYLTRPVKASPFQHQGIAVLAALVALLIGVTAAQAVPFSAVGTSTLGTVLAVSDGLHDIAHEAIGNADTNAQKEFASVDASRYAFVPATATPESSIAIARVTSQLAFVNRPAPTKPIVPSAPAFHPVPAAPLTHPTNTSRTRGRLLGSFDFNSPVSAAVALASLEVHAYIDTGAQTYVAITNGLSSYENGIQESGNATLALGTSIRDLGTSAPRASMALAESEIGAARAVSDLSQDIVQGYSNGVYGWVNESPVVSANVALAEYQKTYEVGSTLATIVGSAPSTIVNGYQAGMNGWVNGTPVVATSIVNGEIAAGTGIADAASESLDAEKSAVDTSANLALGLYQQGTLALAVVPETASVPTTGLRASVDDAVLGALGNGSVGLTFLVQDAPRELLGAVQSSLPSSVLPAPVIALGEQTAISTYDALNGFFSRATSTLAYLFGANSAPATTIASAPTTPAPATSAATVSSPIVTNTTNTTHVTNVTYVTNNTAPAGPTIITNSGSGSESDSGVGGILQDAIDSMKSSLAMAIIDQVDAAVSPLSSSIAANANAIADIQKFTAIAIHGSTFDNGTITNSSLSNVAISSSTFSGSSVTTDTLVVNGSSSFGGAMSFSSTTVNGAFIVNGDMSDTGTTTLNNAVIANGNVTNLTAANATLTAATSTNLFATNLVATNGDLSNLNVSATTSTGGLSVGNLNGFLKATAGAISTSLIDLTTDVENVLPVSSGGTGTSSFATNGVVYGNGTNNLLTTTQGGANSVLVANNGAPSFSSAITVGTSISTPFLSTTNASTTNQTVLGNLYVPGSVASNLIPLTNDTDDLGSPSIYYHNAFVDNLTVNSISAASTSIAGTVSPNFTINSANATNDTVSMALIFFRGMATPNAVIAWDAVNKYFNFNQLVNFAAGATTTQFTSTGNAYLATSGGKVGVGTSTPAVTLDVYGTDALRIPVGTTTQRPAGNTGYIRYNTTTHQFEGFGDNGVWQGLGGVINAAQTTYITAGDDNFLRFVTNGVERMTISNTGEVVMDNDLGVSGTATAGNIIDTGVTANTLLYANGSKQLASATLGNGLTFTTGTLSISTTSLATNFFAQGGNAFGATATLGTTDTNQLNLITSNLPRLSILSGGNVGIGTTAPTANLSIENNYGSTNTALFSVSSSTVGNGSTSATLFSVSNTGNVTINDGADNSLLLSRSSTNYNNISLNGVLTGTDMGISGGKTGDNNLYIDSNASTGAIVFRTNSASQSAIFNSSGFFGIGTTSPSAPLAVVGSGYFTTGVGVGGLADESFTATGATGLGLHIHDTSLNNNTYLTSEAGSTFQINTQGNFKLLTGGSNVSLYATTAGSVGIGTTTPGANFAVQGSGLFSGDISAANMTATGTLNVSGAATAFSFVQNGGIARINSSGMLIANTGVLGFSSTGNSSGTLDSDLSRISAGVLGVGTGAQGNTSGTLLAGAIGIGTTTPGSPLSVNGASFTSGIATVGGLIDNALTANTLQYSNSSRQEASVTLGNGLTLTSGTLAVSTTSLASGFFQQGGNAFGATATLGTTDTNQLNLITSNLPRLSILSGGNVGIGTVSPTQKLDVAGNINIDQFSSYMQAGSSILYASTTNMSTVVGIQAGQAILKSAADVNDVAVGYQALASASLTGNNNTAVGYQALNANTTGIGNTALGQGALPVNTTGSDNEAIGKNTLTSNKTGSDNVAIGFQSLFQNISATSTIAIGSSAALGNGSYHNQNGVIIGYDAGQAFITGSDNNTLIGYDAGFSISSGANNVMLGSWPTATNANLTSGSNNILIGYNNSLPSATGSNQLDIGNLIYGTGINGAASTISTGNIGIGVASPAQKLDVAGNINIDQFSSYMQAGSSILYASSTNQSTAVGIGAAPIEYTSSTVADLTAVGYQALNANTTGINNTAVGASALLSNIDGNQNTAFGMQALDLNTHGLNNNAFGYESLFSNTSGTGNVAMGMDAQIFNQTGSDNVGIGTRALQTNVSGGQNIGIGSLALQNTTGSDNTAFGYQSGNGITIGGRNVLIGPSTISASINQVTTGSNNIAIGNDVAVASPTASNQLDIGNFVYGTGLSGTGTTVSTGFIGIGTTTPTNPLTLPAGSSSLPSLSLGDTATGLYRSAPGSLAVTANGATAGFFSSSGFFGGGSHSAAFETTNASATFASVRPDQQSNSGLGADVTGDVSILNSGAETLRVGTASTDLIQGNFGVGTSTPAGKLSVEGTQTTGQFLYLNSQNSSFTGDVAKIVGFANSSTYNDLNIIDSVGNSKFLVRGDGNVGIGTASPTSKLTVGTAFAQSANSATFTTNAGALGTSANNELKLASLGFTAGTNEEHLGIYGLRTTAGTDWTTTAVGLGIDVDNTTRVNGASLWLNENGNIGIGTTTPVANLQVVGTSLFGPAGAFGSANQSYIDGLSGARFMQFNGSGTLTTSINSSASSYFNGGNVGIGTTTPGTSLSVADGASGGAIANFASTTSTFYSSLSRPAGNPTLLADKIDSGFGSGQVIATVGKYVYSVNNAQVMDIYDVSNPASPVRVSTYTIPDAAFPTSVTVSGRYAYITDELNNGVIIVDVSNPAAPVEVGADVNNDLGAVLSGVAVGNYMYIGDIGNGALEVINVANPTAPKRVGSVTTGITNPFSMTVQGKYAYVANTGSNLDIYDISNPVAPVRVGVTTGASLNQVYVSGRFAYATTNAGTAMIVYDISNPASPTQVGTLTGISGAGSISGSGKYVYVAVRPATSGMIDVIDVSSSTAPVLVGTSPGIPGGLSIIKGIAISGRYAYLDGLTFTVASLDLGGADFNALAAQSLEAGNLNVDSNITAGGQLSVSGVNVGNGGIFSSGPISVGIASSTQAGAISATFQGNVGIGTTSPNVPLDIAGVGQAAVFGDANNPTSTYVSFAPGSGYNNGRAYFGYNGTTGNAVIQGAASKGIEFDVNNSTFGSGQAMTISASGFVGIGTTTPGAELAINTPAGATSDEGYLFNISSSTAGVSTSTLFSVQTSGAGTGVAGGVVNINSALNCIGDAGSCTLFYKSSGRVSLSSLGETFNSAANSGNSGPHFSFVGSTDTGISAGVDAPVMTYLFGNTRTHATGAIAEEDDILYTTPVDTFASGLAAASVISTSSAFTISGAPQIGARGSATNAFGLLINPGPALNASTTNAYGFASIAPTGATNNYAAEFLGGNVGVGTTTPGYLLSVSGNGALGTQAQFGTNAFISNFGAGAYFSNSTVSTGGVWTARGTGSSIVQADATGYDVYVNGSLTPGSTFSPTPVFQVNSVGLTAVGIGNTPGGWSGNQNFSVASQGTSADSWGFSADVNGGTTGGAFLDDTTNTSLGLMVMYYNHSAQVGSIYTNGSSVSYNTTSDRRLKTNIVPTTEGLSTLMQIPVDDFNYITQPGATQQGYIAQDLYNYYPIAVHVGGADPTTDPWSVDYGRLTPLIMSSVQQLAKGYSLSNTSASSTVASSYAGVAAPAIFVDATGNVGIGTSGTGSTTLSSKIMVNGDASVIGTVYGNSFVATGAGANFSTMYGSVAVGSTTAASVLSPDGKNVDVFKLATFALSGVQQLEAQQAAIATQTTSLATQVTSLSQRVSALETGAAAGLANASSTSSSSLLSATSTQLASALESFGVLLQDGLAQFNTLVVRNLVFSKDADGTSAAGSGTVLAGNTTVEIDNVDMLATSQVSVTLTSPLSGNWYVSNKQNGSFRVTLSSAQTADVTFDYVIIQTQGQIATSTPTGYLGSPFSWLNALFGGSSSTPSNGGQVSAGVGDSGGSGTTGTTTSSTGSGTASSTPAGAPTVILNGSPAISLNQNDAFIDPGNWLGRYGYARYLHTYVHGD